MAISGTSSKLKSKRTRHSVSDGHQTTSGVAEELEVVATETSESSVVLEIKTANMLGAVVKADSGPEFVLQNGKKLTVTAL